MMKNLTTILILGALLFMGISSSVLGQSSNSEGEGVSNQVSVFLQQVYGDYYEEYGEPRLEFFQSIYYRIEYFSDVGYETETITNLSELLLMDKYNPEVVKHPTQFDEFDVESFNPFMYRTGAFTNTKDLYFRVYNTGVIMKINKMQ